ncbi:MAG: DNA-deoxyinosine glycosylase, partial [Candidatus Gastranaerophilaceae bacterium]
DYSEKINVLLQNNIALWDVVKFCNRVGSLDSDIKNEIPNEIPELLQKYPNIEKICLNGNKSYSSFKKYFPFLLQQYECCKMPSTSPANAKFSFDDLFEMWSNPF